MILPADKGKATVVMDKVEYEDKITGMLSDVNTYKSIPKDPAPALERRLNSFLLSLRRSGALSEQTYYKLRSSASKTPQLYGLPKIHKPDVPLRPIVSFITSPTYHLSKHLVAILSPLVGLTSSHVGNSHEFSTFIRSQVLDEGMILVSFDVVSLFTRVPVDRAIEVANSRLLADETLSDRTALSPKEIIQLLEFCLNATYLCHQGRFFQQTFGTAMGSPVSVTVANLVMEDVETRAISPATHTPLFWKRYVDDICTALQKSHVEEFKDHLNTIEPTIQFTVELESNGKLSFLDTEILHNDNGVLTTSVFRKKTHTDKYLSFDSHHPFNHRVSVIKTLFDRAEKLCTTQGDKDDEIQHVTTALLANGYPRDIVSKYGHVKKGTRSDRMEPKATVVLPYVKNVSESIRRILTPLNIRTCFRPVRTLRQFLVHPKDQLPISRVSGVVYSIPCQDCDKTYIGQTGRTLEHRVKEHKRAYTSQLTH